MPMSDLVWLNDMRSHATCGEPRSWEPGDADVLGNGRHAPFLLQVAFSPFNLRNYSFKLWQTSDDAVKIIFTLRNISPRNLKEELD